MRTSPFVVALVVAALAASAAGQATSRASVGPGGAQSDKGSTFPSISTDGRYVAFQSTASNLVPGDTNGVSDVFVRDRQTGTTERVSVDSGGGEGNGGSYFPSISADGRYVAFLSYADDLVTGDTNTAPDVFVRDRQGGATERVTVATSGVQGNAGSYWAPAISADGRYVAYQSNSRNLVGGDTNAASDVFVRDRQAGTTERVSVDSGGGEGNGSSAYGSISADGRYVAFASAATDLVAGDTNGVSDIFVRDRQTGTTERVSVDSGGAQGNASCYEPSTPGISADGRYVAFVSYASDLVPGDTNGLADVFVRDRQGGTTDLVSVDSGGTQGNTDSSGAPSISADGRFVACANNASNFAGGDSNGASDVFVRDRQGGTTVRVSVDSGGAQADGSSGYFGLSISGDGRYVAFASDAGNLVTGDTNSQSDIFVRDRTDSPFTSLCDPGVGAVIACPCSNPPGGLGRGCDNSSATGGAVLSASGLARLSADSLVFTTSGQKPTTLSLLLQGPTSPPAGLAYGQGVRCVAGALKRLFAKTAAGGSITAPNFGAGDPTVSARSAAKGDVIQAGQSRWYLVVYRDPIVLGGCPATSKFNVSQTGRVDWNP